MPQCIGLTKAGTQCTHQARLNQERCRTHERMAADAAAVAAVAAVAVALAVPAAAADTNAIVNTPAAVVVRCTHRTRTRQCETISEEGTMICRRHRILAERIARRLQFNQQVNTILAPLNAAFTAGEPHMTWQEVVTRLHARSLAGEFTAAVEYDVGLIYVNLHGGNQDEFDLFYNHLVNFGVPPPPPAPRPPARAIGTLARIARDRQNVHTNAVSQQTNRGVEIFLNTPVPRDQRTLQEITRQWCDQFELEDIGLFGRVMVDLNYWFRRDDCREPGDWLYRRLLNGFWAYVNQHWSPKSNSTETFLIRNEICKRLWEEAVDGVELCCDGHISRLVSVLIGFDASFLGVQSLGEAIQNRMAAIAAGEGTAAEKIAAATLVFDEMGVTNDERVAWFEAF